MLVILKVQTFTVILMVSLISIYALFAQQLINKNIICNYVVLYCKNLKMAYLLQIFLVGSLVRKIFKIIFKNQNSK